MRLAIFVDVFSELSETFILNEVKALATEGVDVRVESAKRSQRPNPEAADAPPVPVASWAQPGSRDENLRALAWLWTRHPLRVLRDLNGRLRWRRDEAVRPLRRLAPVARRLAGGGGHPPPHPAPG